MYKILLFILNYNPSDGFVSFRVFESVIRGIT